MECGATRAPLASVRDHLLKAKGEKDTDTDTQAKWKKLGDLALALGDLLTAEQCAYNASDLAGLFLLCSTRGDSAGLQRRVADAVRAAGKTNVAFVMHLLLSQVEECLELLVSSGRMPEATFPHANVPAGEMRFVDGGFGTHIKYQNPMMSGYPPVAPTSGAWRGALWEMAREIREFWASNSSGSLFRSISGWLIP